MVHLWESYLSPQKGFRETKLHFMLTITKTSRNISIIAWQNLNLLVTKPFVICAEASQSVIDFGNTVV